MDEEPQKKRRGRKSKKLNDKEIMKLYVESVGEPYKTIERQKNIYENIKYLSDKEVGDFNYK